MRAAPLVCLLLATGSLSGQITPSNVVRVHGSGNDMKTVRSMVSTGITALTGQNDETRAWQQFVSSKDVVGIKVNTQSGPLQVTRPAVVHAILQGLCSAGVAPSRILLWDRDDDKLRAAGYSHPVTAVAPDGWDDNHFYENKLVGKLIWGDRLFGREEHRLSTRSHLPRLLTQTITKLINVPVLQDHDACGMAGCLYNLSLGAVDNTRRFEMHGQTGDPAIAEICALPFVRSKLVLNIMDALVAGFAGGTSFKPQYSWEAGALYFSQDPVAIDVLGLEQLEAKRREARVPEIGARASHMATAARLGLGTNNRNQIRLIETGP